MSDQRSATQETDATPAQSGHWLWSGPRVSWPVMCLTTGFMAVLCATLIYAVGCRLPGGQSWAPLLAWLVAGVLIGATLQRRLTAMTVGLFTTCTAGIASAIINRLAPTGEQQTAQTATMTLICTLTCLLGATIVVELRRELDQRKRRHPRG